MEPATVFFTWLLFGIASAVVASNKGRSGCAWLILGFILGPFGLILSLVVSKNQSILEKKVLNSGEMKKCPFCAELIRVEAKVCRYCQRNIVSLEPIIAKQVDTSEKLAEERLAYALKPKGNCPNCNAIVPLDSGNCPKCKASFGLGSAWKIRPFDKNY